MKKMDGWMEKQVILQKLKIPEEVSSKSCEKDRGEKMVLKNDLGKKYIDETKWARSSKPFFIDKMPNNFVHIGLIKLILPKAKIIDARRNPMDACFSCFKQYFAI